MSDRFLTPNNLIAVLQQGVITGIVALGMTVVLIGGQFDLSTGAIVMMSAVMALSIGPDGPDGIALAVLLPLIAGAAIGVINGLAVYRAGANSIVATIGMQFLVIGATLAAVSGQHVHAENIGPVFSAIAHARPFGVPLPVILFRRPHRASRGADGQHGLRPPCLCHRRRYRSGASAPASLWCATASRPSPCRGRLPHFRA